MRVLALALVALTLLAAGCFGGDDDGDAPPTTTTPETTPTTTPTDATPTTPTNATPTPTSPAGPPPPMECSFSGTFSNAAPGETDGGSDPTPCEVPERYTSATLNVTWGGTPPVGEAVSVSLVDPDGGVVASCDYAPPTPPATEPAPCSQTGSLSGAGTYQVVYEGLGTVTASGTVTLT